METFEIYGAGAGARDPTEDKIAWLSTSWTRDTVAELLLLHCLEVFTGLRCVPSHPGIMSARTLPVHVRYRKIMAVVKHVESRIDTGSTTSFHSAIESFAMHSEGQWLKVAGGQKAEVLQGLSAQTPCVGLALELGTFVGYTASRLGAMFAARHVRGSVNTVECDPVHAFVASHFVNLVALRALVEVRLGMVRDAVALVLKSGVARLVCVSWTRRVLHFTSTWSS